MGNGSTGPQILQYKFSGARFQTCHCEEGESPTRQSREGTCSSHKPPLKWCVSIASVAALTAQPLAALPPYGCGVPLAGSERHWQLQIPVYPADRTGHQICHCEGALRPWQSRAGSCDFADRFPTMRPGTARFPRRFAPRNDNSGTPARSTMPLPA